MKRLITDSAIKTKNEGKDKMNRLKKRMSMAREANIKKKEENKYRKSLVIAEKANFLQNKLFDDKIKEEKED